MSRHQSVDIGKSGRRKFVEDRFLFAFCSRGDRQTIRYLIYRS